MEFSYPHLVDPFQEVQYGTVKQGADLIGYIVWRKGTGGNVELLHIRVEKPGQGTATELLKGMLRALADDPPYATIFGFTRTSNESAQGFYKWAGFELSEVKGVYADGSAIIFSAPYDALCEKHLGGTE